MPYSAEITQKLDRDLVDVFDETGFPEELAKYCADNGVTKVMAFADLAESKAEIVKIMARVAALDAEDPIKCQPIKSAWRIADARAKAALDAAATGKEVETIRIMGPTERAKVDAAAEKRFSFRWPPTLMPCSALLAKIEAVYRKFLKETPRIQEARSILDKGALTSQVTFSWKPGANNVMGTTAEEDGPEVTSIWAFRTKHQILMIAYVHADAPDFAVADLTTVLDYHEWLMTKLHADPRPKLGAIIDADFRMRTEWMLSLTNREFSTITAAIKHHRSESIHLFSSLPNARSDGGTNEQGKRLRTGQQPQQVQAPRQTQPPRQSGNQNNQAKDGGKGGKDKGANKTCDFYNKQGGCRTGAACLFKHTCNYPNCRDPRPRFTHNH